NFASQLYFSDSTTNAIYARTSPYNTRPNRNPASNTGDGIYNAALLTRLSDNASHVVASFNAVVNSISGLTVAPTHPLLTPTDEDSLEHLYDFGGGTPPFAIL